MRLWEATKVIGVLTIDGETPDYGNGGILKCCAPTPVPRIKKIRMSLFLRCSLYLWCIPVRVDVDGGADMMQKVDDVCIESNYWR